MTISFWFDMNSVYLQTFPIHLYEVIRKKAHNFHKMGGGVVRFQPKGSLVGRIIQYHKVAMENMKVTHVSKDATSDAHSDLIAGMLKLLLPFLEPAYG